MGSVKELLDKIKDSALTAWLAAGIGVFLFLSGMKLFAGIAFGFFLKSNWDIISKWLEGKTGVKF